MIQSFINKIQKNIKIAIFGCGYAGIGLQKYIEQNRKDLEITFFVDSYKNGFENGIKIIKTKDLKNYKKDFDLLLIATTKDLHELITYFSYIEIPHICIDRLIEEYYRHPDWFEKLQKVLDFLESKEDKELYKEIWTARLTAHFLPIEKHALKKYDIDFRKGIPYNNSYHYLENIKTNAVKTILDCGFLNGNNSLAFHQKFQNLKNYYAFEPNYQNVKVEAYDEIIQKLGFNIIPLGIWEKETTLLFAENKFAKGSSRVINNEDDLKASETLSKIKTTSIDLYCKKNNINKIDFIKMDIEGAELPALKGAIETIKKDRPQLAISIYHSNNDFLEIPLFLKQNLSNYTYKIGHYAARSNETVLYAIPKELS